MSLFPQTFLDDLHLNADIVQVIGDVVSLKRSGATWKGLCPFHGEKTPSFHVNREKGFFHCFGCHVGGDVIKFVELHEKVSFPEAVRMLAGRFGLTVPEAPDTESSGTHRGGARGAPQGARGRSRVVPGPARIRRRRASAPAARRAQHQHADHR
jgi:DNA primase